MSSFAILGGKPKFDSPIPVGQRNFPTWAEYENAMRGIFGREYYNNNGPLLTELEARLQEFLGVKHAMVVSNETMSLMITLDALDLTSGKVLLPGFASVTLAQSIRWAGAEPVFCDVNPLTQMIDLDSLRAQWTPDVKGVLAVNAWGGYCDVKALEAFAREKNIKLVFDSAGGFGCTVDGKRTGGFGNAEIFSFQQDNILNSTEGGCICTNDDGFADRVRAIRPSYGVDKVIPIVRVANARMSEAQAAVALLTLKSFDVNRKRNQTLFEVYEQGLKDIPGIRLFKPSGVDESNFQDVVCEVSEKIFGLSRDQLLNVLRAENVEARECFTRGSKPSEAFKKFTGNSPPISAELKLTTVQLPIGALVDEDKVAAICQLISSSQKSAKFIHGELSL